LEDFFLKSFPFEKGVSLLIEQVSQKCASGNLFSDGWRDQMLEKQIFINKCLNTFKKGEIAVFTDVDIRFYGKIKADLTSCLEGKDICFMKDHNTDEHGRCGGFFVVRVSSKIRSFFEEVANRLSSNKDSKVSFETSEQCAINNILNDHCYRRGKQSGSDTGIEWGYLPARYYTHGLYVEGIENFSMEDQSGLWWENKNWSEKSCVFVPDDILVHHANWCHGVDNKLHLLNWIKEIVDQK
jgi:hypothetical protein